MDNAAIWSANMGWRYITYAEGKRLLCMQIEPVVKGCDLVYVPDQKTWDKVVPSWAALRRVEIIERLKSVAWHRQLQWVDSKCGVSSPEPASGLLESTKGGIWMEEQHLFDPTSPLTFEEARIAWITLVKRFASEVKGEVTIFACGTVADSIFQEIELPILKNNPNVTINFK